MGVSNEGISIGNLHHLITHLWAKLERFEWFNVQNHFVIRLRHISQNRETRDLS